MPLTEGGTLAALVAAQLGSEISGGQGAGGVMGQTAQDLIRAQNFMNLIKTLGGTGPAQVAAGQQPVQPQPQPQVQGTGTTAQGPKINISGTSLNDISRALQGEVQPTQQELTTPGGAGDFAQRAYSNFLKAR